MRWYSVAEGKRIPRKKGQPANSKKHSDLYTDENPKGTIHGLGFKDEATARSSVSKIRKSGRSHAHKIQAAVAMEQRAKAAGKSGPASIYRKYINSMKKKTKQKNEEAAGVGIVTKQNATKDVPVGGEYMNVKKLHLGKGKPKEHPKKTKGSKTNVLFNLGMAESEKDIKYRKPNLDHEWDEATRYEEFKKIGKDKWTDLVSKGKVVEYNTKTVQKMSNTDAVNVKDFDNLDKNKQERALKQLEKGSIELPIVASYSDGHLELVGGNTRLTAVMKATGKGKVWQFDVPDKVAKLAEADDPRQQQIAKRRINDLQQAMMLNNKLKSRWEQTFPPGKYQYPIESRKIDYLRQGELSKLKTGREYDEPIVKRKLEKSVNNLMQFIQKYLRPYPGNPIQGSMKRLGSQYLQQLNILKQKIVGNRYESFTKTELAIMEGGHSLDDYYKSIKEVSVKDLSKESEIYVDMDGVLADFFGAWKKLIGTDWREIKDLDSALQKIRDKDDFWLNIPVTKNAMNLLSLIKGLKGKYNILSAPLPNDPNSEPHKREWIEKNLSAFPPSKVIITSNKSVHATQPDGTPNILIDDFGKNIAKWESAGGVGFKHKDHKFERTVKNLKAYMDKPVEEAKMSKSSIKSIHKTADKIKDKPKAKKSISNWAKERGMDPEGAIYAIATNMKKRKQGKKITGLGKESYTREELPQITKTDLKYIPHHMETVEVASLVPVQKERIKENHTAQLLKILEGRFNPIVVDCYNRIVNGHHRYDVVKMLKMENITVVKLPFTLEFLLEGNLIPNPQRSVLVKKNDGYDHYKLATHIANIKKMSPRVAKRNKQDIFVQFYGGEKEKEYMMKNLKRLGFGVQDADGYRDGHFDENIEGSYILRISENFADGKKKGKSRPGRVKRSGASCKGSVTSLRSKAKKASGERAKMYHWCANMKSGRKKSESYTKSEFYNILVESTPQQLEEGIKDQLAKLPKNLLAKVQPIIKKIPKTGKSLVLVATLLGVMVNAVAAGDMAKADVQVDKLNNMATMSTTADAPTKADKGGFDLDDVNYDRNYKGDVNKVFAVQGDSVKDAKAMYDKLGGVSGDNFEKMSKIVYDKIDDLRSDYQDAVKKKGLSGKDVLQSDEYKDFRKQSNDLKIMLSKAMEIMTKNAGATGKILKGTGKIIK